MEKFHYIVSLIEVAVPVMVISLEYVTVYDIWHIVLLEIHFFTCYQKEELKFSLLISWIVGLEPGRRKIRSSGAR